jgi:hypothetical protein
MNINLNPEYENEMADRTLWYRSAIIILIIFGFVVLFYLFFSKEANKELFSRNIVTSNDSTLFVNKSIDF